MNFREPITEHSEAIIADVLQEFLEEFIHSVPLSRVNFPIFELTFSLWRKNAYKKVEKQLGKSPNKSEKLTFHKISEQKYLPEFINKVKAEMNVYRRGVKNIEIGLKSVEKLPQMEENILNTMLELGETIWEQQLYIELIHDLIELPYLEVFPPGSSLTTKSEFETEYNYKVKKEGQLAGFASKAGKGIFNKALFTFTSFVFSKTFVFRINTLIGTIGAINPLSIGASFGLKSYLEHLESKNKQEEIEADLIESLNFGKSKLSKVKEVYNFCLTLISLILELDILDEIEKVKEHKKTLKAQFLSIFEEEWLKIEIVKESDGWDVVKFEETETFEELTND